MNTPRFTLSALCAFALAAVCWLGVLPRELPRTSAIEKAMTPPGTERSWTVRSPAVEVHFPIAERPDAEAVVWIQSVWDDGRPFDDASLAHGAREVAMSIYLSDPHTIQIGVCGNAGLGY